MVSKRQKVKIRYCCWNCYNYFESESVNRSDVYDSATQWTVWSPPGFSVHGILKARILEWVAIPLSGTTILVHNNFASWTLSHRYDQTNVQSTNTRMFIGVREKLEMRNCLSVFPQGSA